MILNVGVKLLKNSKGDNKMKKLTINLHFTDFCNFKCKHCFVERQGKELSLENIKIIIDKIVEFSKDRKIKIRINLAGGEPLISKNIQSIIDYIFSKGLEVSLITNGYYLTEEFIKENQIKLSMIGMSIDSLCIDTNVKIGRCEKNQALTENQMIEKCLWVKNAGLKLKVNICISKLNVEENLSDFLGKVRPDRIKILRVLCDHNPALKYLSITNDEWTKTKERYVEETSIFEDNDFMQNGYLIIDSEGNLSKNNLHLNNNSLLSKNVDECFEALNQVN